MAILNENEFVEVEGRAYPNPQVALDESNAFIDKLRSTQQANNQEIQTQTYNLGTAVPSQLGGLGAPGDASMSYFTSRYQVPQTESAVANLRATAQAAALNQVLENEQAKWKNRYQQAYRNYQRRASSGGNNPLTTNPENPAGKGDGETKSTSKKVGSVEPSFSPLDFSGNYTYDYYTKGATGAVSGKPLVTGITVVKDKTGNVISITENGRTRTGEDAAARYDTLDRLGELRGRKNEG